MFDVRFHDSMDAFTAGEWDALAGSANPFVSHAFLAGLERHRCIRAEWGWRPHHVAIHENGRLLAAAPLYLKGNSRGEFVFDWSWAHAWEDAGGRYYPKLLNAVPWSPVSGPRLLAADGENQNELRQQLVEAMQAECTRMGLSSVHANFLAADDLPAFGSAWLQRFDLQYHWHNHGYGNFEEFLAALRHKKRKNMRHERAQAAESGLSIAMHDGAELDDDEWHAVHALYCQTFDEKGNVAVLSVAFLRHLATSANCSVRVATARRGRQIIAMALFLEGGDTLYGRYWGSREHLPGLHFELCYYQGIDHCIRHGLAHFEPGAQGEHKMARGFVPTPTYSRHFIAHGGFRAAVAAALARETQAMAEYQAELEARSPYAQSAEAVRRPAGSSP
ncbi:MAG: GNAT family N-acetyltransferase [Rhodanobacteraceae bacterium]